jgi:uncharacterized membrane-anchored protein
VPDATGWFWIAVVLIAGMGQTASGSLCRGLGPVGAGALGVTGLATLLIRQLRQGRYVAWAYWPALVAASVVGAMAADAVHALWGAGYAAVTVAFALTLAAIMAVWFAVEATVSGGSVRTARREALHWASVLTVSALGTATGDLTASSLPGGYLVCAALFLVLIAVPAVGGLKLRRQATAACWSAFVLARPLGVCFAEWMATDLPRGGLGWGDGQVSVLLAVVIAGLVGRLADEQHNGDPPADPTRA